MWKDCPTSLSEHESDFQTRREQIPNKQRLDTLIHKTEFVISTFSRMWKALSINENGVATI